MTITAKIIIAILTVHALWGLGQFIFQQDFGLQKIGETDLAPDQPAIAKFTLCLSPSCEGESEGMKIVRAYGPYPHPNSFAGALVIGLILLLSLKKNPEPKTKTIIFGILLIALLLTFSRAALLAFLIFFLLYQIKKPNKKLILITLVVLLTFSPLLLARQQDSQDVALPERYSGYKWSVELIQANYLTGVGYDNYKTALANYLNTNHIPHQPWQIDYVHSVPLLIIAQWGIVRGALLFTLLFWLFRKNPIILFSLTPIIFLDHYLITQATPLILLIILGYNTNTHANSFRLSSPSSRNR